MKPFVFRFRLERVKDADTLFGEIDLGLDTTVKRQSVRLADCWAPEKGTEAGLVALIFTQSWSANSKTLILDSLKYNPSRSFERIVGIVYRDDDPVSLNEALIAAGHATKERPA
jgi:endonuclease YncB( thermonuclease family)